MPRNFGSASPSFDLLSRLPAADNSHPGPKSSFQIRAASRQHRSVLGVL
jgi:hypothetical protein